MNKYFFLIIFLVLAGCSDDPKLQALETNAIILAFGDSLTYGTGTSRDKAYPAVLASLVNRTVINAGIPGEISKTGLSRLNGLIKQHQPDLIIICHGANDILRKLDLRQTQENIQQMIELARQDNIQLVLIAVPEFSLFLNDSPIYQTLAEKNHIPVADNILGDILAKNAYKSDHVHPNSQGYQMLAIRIAEILKQSGAI
jgi:acyl-CoA thioesterase-1